MPILAEQADGRPHSAKWSRVVIWAPQRLSLLLPCDTSRTRGSRAEARIREDGIRPRRAAGRSPGSASLKACRSLQPPFSRTQPLQISLDELLMTPSILLTEYLKTLKRTEGEGTWIARSPLSL